MIKKNCIICMALVIGRTLAGQLGKNIFSDRGLCDITKIEDLESYSFSLESVETKEDEEYYEDYADDYVDEFLESELILVGIPTGEYRMGTAAGMQEVKVENVLKGNKELVGQQIWLDGMPGLSYYEDEDLLRMDAILNLMNEEHSYLIACDAYGDIYLNEVPECSKYYEIANCIFGYLDLTNRNNTGLIADTKTLYTYNDIKKYEFFGTSQDLLDKKQMIKNRIIREFF